MWKYDNVVNVEMKYPKIISTKELTG